MAEENGVRDNGVRLAMARADTQGVPPKTEVGQNGAVEVRRVHVKHEISAYIDQIFQARTMDDGTMLHTSREMMVEELTNIVEALLKKALGGRRPAQTQTYNIPPGTQQ